MKKILVAGIAAAAFCGAPALAADMPTKAPVYAPVAVYDWSGIYIGGDAGWQGSTIDLSRVDPPGTLSYSPRHSSFALGAFVGAQRQFGQFVLGVEGGYMSAFGDTSLGAVPALSIFTPGGTGTAQAKLKDIWSVGGRLGWAMGQWMPYLTGGYASGSFQFNAQCCVTGTEQANARTGGGYIGGGIDWAVWQNWILGLEYRHYGFNAKTGTGPFSTGGFENVRFDTSTDTVLARLSYKFNPWGGR
jgi:outer membrane immunogenic protein